MIETFIKNRLQNHQEKRMDAADIWQQIEKNSPVINRRKGVKRFGLILWPVLIAIASMAVFFSHQSSSIEEQYAFQEKQSLAAASTSSEENNQSNGIHSGDLGSDSVEMLQPAAIFQAYPPSFVVEADDPEEIHPNRIGTTEHPVGDESSERMRIEQLKTSSLAGKSATTNLHFSPVSQTNASNTQARTISILPTLRTRDCKLISLPRTLSHDHRYGMPSLDVRPQGTWHIQLMGGVGQSQAGLTNRANIDYFMAYKDAHRSQLGQHVLMLIKHRFKSGLNLSSGLGISSDWMQFRLTQKSSALVKHENALVHVVVHAVSRDTLVRTFADTNVLHTTTRQVVHHNRFDQISIPLELGFERSSHRWQYGIQGGLQLNLLINQKGKTIDREQKLVTYSNENPRYRKSNTIVNIRPWFGYRVGEKLSVTLSSSLGWSLGDRLLTIDLTSRPIEYRLNLGISRKF